MLANLAAANAQQTNSIPSNSGGVGLLVNQNQTNNQQVGGNNDVAIHSLIEELLVSVSEIKVGLEQLLLKVLLQLIVNKKNLIFNCLRIQFESIENELTEICICNLQFEYYFRYIYFLFREALNVPTALYRRSQAFWLKKILSNVRKKRENFEYIFVYI